MLPSCFAGACTTVKGVGRPESSSHQDLPSSKGFLVWKVTLTEKQEPPSCSYPKWEEGPEAMAVLGSRDGNCRT